MKSLKVGWMPLNAFIKKYYPKLTDKRDFKLKRDALIKRIQRNLSNLYYEQVDQAYVVKEEEFCEYLQIIMKGETNV